MSFGLGSCVTGGVSGPGPGPYFTATRPQRRIGTEAGVEDQPPSPRSTSGDLVKVGGAGGGVAHGSENAGGWFPVSCLAALLVAATGLKRGLVSDPQPRSLYERAPTSAWRLGGCAATSAIKPLERF